MSDMAARGRANPVRGEDSPNAILTEPAVVEIRKRLTAGESCSSIANDYGVSHYTIFDVKAGRSWRHVEEAA
jgi:hypothetical protein